MRIDKVFSYFNMIDRNKSKAIEKGKNENYDAYMDIDGEGKNTKEEAKYALFKRVLEAQRTAPKLRTVEQKKLLSINKKEYELTLDEKFVIMSLFTKKLRKIEASNAVPGIKADWGKRIAVNLSEMGLYVEAFLVCRDIKDKYVKAGAEKMVTIEIARAGKYKEALEKSKKIEFSVTKEIEDIMRGNGLSEAGIIGIFKEAGVPRHIGFSIITPYNNKSK